jgi:hypothetical protein
VALARFLIIVPATACVAALLCSGCGLQVRSPDLFLLQRTGEGEVLSLLVNDGGTIRCNASLPKPLSDKLLIAARDLADDLDKDAKAKLRIPANVHSVYVYDVRLQDGTIAFPDNAGEQRSELARAEQFTLQAAHQACGLAG